MNHRRPTLPVLLAALALGSSSCSEQAREQAEQAAAEARQSIEAATAPGGELDTAIAEARSKLHNENLRLGVEGQTPKAELTPQGDLLINGHPVPMTPEQREAALAYRAGVIAVAEAGMALGEDIAAIAGQAVSVAVAGIFEGRVNATSAKIEAEAKKTAEKMEPVWLALCRRAQGLTAAQERLAALLPEFKPYAKAIDIPANCPVDVGADDPTAP